MPKTEQSRRINGNLMAKKITKSTRPAGKKMSKPAPKKAAKKVVKKAIKKASRPSAPVKAAKKTVKKASKPTAKPVRKAAKKESKKPAVAAVAPKFLSVNPYLTFNGNCEEAFNFYRSVLGGNFTYVGRFKEMPPSPDGKTVSAAEGEKIMHISLPISKETILMGSDSSEEFGHATVVGNNFSISLNAPSEKDADRIYKGLAEGGKAIMPMSKTFWGSYFGMLVDKFHIQWMISC
jgi:PhnB protein